MTARKADPQPERPRFSIVIPVYNEEESLHQLHGQLSQALSGESYEILFVDDGSTDASPQRMNDIYLRDPQVRVIRFGRNVGKSEALAAGFRESRGEIVVTLDADLQDDPAEIPRLVAALENGYDLVSGWKLPRRDSISKTLPSRLFNWVTARLTGIPLHDFNCGLKAYRRRLVENLHLYGEQHRFIPALAYWKGFTVTEIGVKHHPRAFGRSKFGAERFLAGFLDLLTVLFLTRFNRKPLHLFGSIGLLCFLAGLVINLYLTYLRFLGETIGNRPLLMLGVLLMVMGVQFFSMGLLGEMLSFSSAHEREGRHVYQVLDSPRPLRPPAAAPLAPTTIRDEAAHP